MRPAISPLARFASLVICLALVAPPSLFAPAEASAGKTTGGVVKSPPPAPAGPSGAPKWRAQVREGELLVRLREGVSAEEGESLVAAFGLKSEGRLRGASGLLRLKTLPGQAVEAVLPALQSSPLVDFAEPNFTITADQTRPNDPRFPEQWSLGGATPAGGQAGVGAASAWRRTVGSRSTTVAVIDSGIDFTHPDLRRNFWTNPRERDGGPAAEDDGYAGDLHGWDWVAAAGEVKDENGHGTAVAGLIAAVGNNREGVAGVMWRAGLMSLRVLDREGKGSVADAVEAIDYAVAHGAHVVNCSWGLDEPSEALRQAIIRAAKSEVTVVCSAGNGGRELGLSPRYPASFEVPHVLAVAATDESGDLIASSNRGARYVTVAAPGASLLTTKPGGGYGLVSGTSAAAALVSGVAGLVRTLRPRLGAARTSEMILKGSRPVPALRGKVSPGGVLVAASTLGALDLVPPGEGLNGSGEGADGADEDKASKVFVAPPAGAAGNGATTTPAVRGEASASATNLPDLNEARRRPHEQPRAIPPVPSTLRRCPPHNPHCNDQPDGEARPRPTPGPRAAKEGSGGWTGVQLARSIARSLLGLLASEYAGGGHPYAFLNTSGYYDAGAFAVSDSPPALLGRPHGPTEGEGENYLGRPLVAAPVAIFNSTNLAVGKPASQSSEGWGGAPGRAVDANTSGDWNVGSVTHTLGDYQAWWQVDLGAVYPIDSIKVWNRTDCCGDRLSNFYLLVSDQPFASTDLNASLSQSGVSNFYTAGQAGSPTTVGVNRSGRYVRVQLAGTNYLSLAEVEVFQGAAGGSYNAVADFSASQNPAGAWRYGYRPSGGSFTPYTYPSTGFGAGANTWALPGQTCCPMVTKNNTGATYTYPAATSVVHPPDVLNLHPGAGGERSVVRWSAPSSGSFAVAGRFQGIDTYGTTTDALITHNGATVFSGAVSGYGSQLPYSLSLTVAAGDILEFSVGVGSNGTYYQDSTGLAVTISQSAVPSPGLWARYYDNMNFTAFKVGRVDPKVDFEWHSAAPDPSVGPDQFSVRWTGMVVPRYSESYTFYTQSDDGVRLWVGGSLIIDNWTDHGWTTNTGTITLDAGAPTPIKMEFYENGGGAIAKLEWSSLSQGREIIPSGQLSSCWKGSAQFVRDFYQGALHRQPTGSELQEWSARLTQAQGQDQLRSVAAALGQHIFNSAEYLTHNPSDNSHFISDCYWGYLQRAPDAGGLNYWTGVANSSGRAAVLPAFEQSTEFNEKTQRMCDASAAVGSGDSGYSFSTARLDPNNRTGGGGADPYSRNFNWSLPLLSLPGRAGFDFGLALSYNSLVWTKDGAGITFDADRGWPSPGFRLGFPVIQQRFLNPQTGRYAYLLVTPAGARVELRQVGTSNVYESADSSHLQLTQNGGALTLSSTDGTRLGFVLINGEFQCVEVRDRHGNYISAGYDQAGLLRTVTDTLGRVITFNYDAYQNLNSITQPWKRETEAGAADEPHAWATFGYTNLTLQPSFSGLTVVGEQPGTVIPVINQVGLADGSYYRFHYNQWGQVWKITHFAADSVVNGVAQDTHALSHTRLNLPGSDLLGATPQADCPRFTERRVWVENGVMNQSAEVTTSYSAWSANMASCDVTLPGATISREFYGTLWMRGLTTQSETWSAGQRKKWTTLDWVHDGAGADGYATNPRVRETNAYDEAGNRRRTTVSYTTYGMPQDVSEYDADGVTVLRTTRTEYNLSTEYTSRRLLGLPSARYLYEGPASPANLRSKVDYVYDDAALPDYLQALPAAATQHDGAAYGPGFRWRGNLSRLRRFEVNQETGAETGAYVESQVGYYVTGTVAFSRDAAGHQMTFGYSDSFYQNVNRSSPQLQTFAYPTVVTDPGNFSVTTVYNYDLGEVTQTTDPKNAIAKTRYDSAGRVERVTRRDGVNNADLGYTRWVYFGKMDVVQSYTLLEGGTESYAASLLDGAGRVRGTARDLPGSAGGYSGQFFDFDSTGRLARRSNPTETTAAGNWPATGDDAAAGWLYTQFGYDWQGRQTSLIHPDGAQSNASYGGCGCAGGEVVTLTDEGTRWSDGALRRRQRRVTRDVLGREVKAEALNWDGTVYASTVTRYNARDQVRSVKVYEGQATADGSCTAPSCQMTTVAYDGHGRLLSRHVPQQDAGKATTYSYNADDTVNTVTDARNVVVTYGYNSRHLVTSVSYNTANAPGVAGVTTVGFDYDAMGNRLWMTDGSGRVDYGYDTMSRLTSETRIVNGLAGSFSLSYSYNLADQLKSLTDPDGRVVHYNYDRAGRLNSVNGTGYNVAQFAANMSYRAWGGVKHFDAGYSLNTSVDYTYNARLLPTRYHVQGPTFPGGRIQYTNAEFNYYPDGRVRFAEDDRTYEGAEVWHNFDRSYTYDHVGRLTEALTGNEARGGVGADGPYKETYQYDTRDHLVSRVNRIWSRAPDYFSATYVNNRNQNWQYDAEGNVTRDDNGPNGYDAAGRKSSFMTWLLFYPFGSWGADPSWNPTDARVTFDGDGNPIKEEDTSGSYHKNLYYIPSTVLGGQHVLFISSEWDDHAPSSVTTTRRVSIYADGARLADSNNGVVGFEYTSPVTGRRLWGVGSNFGGEVETDPLGQEVGTYDPGEEGAGDVGGYPEPREYGNSEDVSLGCVLDGITISCSDLSRQMEAGATAVDYLIHNGRRWEREQVPIIPLGLGMYMEPTPVIGRDEEGPEINWQDLIFSFAPQSNPNCMLNFVKAGDKTATKLARQFEEGHDGRHAVSPIESPNEARGYGGDIVALPALEGSSIVQWGFLEAEGGGKGYYMDVLLKNGMTLRLKDVSALSRGRITTQRVGKSRVEVWRGLQKGVSYAGKREAIPVKPGQTLGNVNYNYKNPDTGLSPNWTGLHVTLIKPGEHANYNRAVRNGLPKMPYLIDPLAGESPFNCPQYRDKIFGSATGR